MLKKLTVAASILLAALIVVPAMRCDSRHPSHARVVLELQQLDDALNQYRARQGELFPPSGIEPILKHLRKIRPETFDFEETFAKGKLDLLALDDAEVLVLFLSEKLDKILGGPRNGFFEFAETRLVDTDGDGWMEYSSPEHQLVRYDGSHPIVFCLSLGVWIAPEPPEKLVPGR